ncbi:hypothetical protein PGT21_023843 [Puccinia graminis f. sp. tritici]|uniref:Uncharacterized protein n=1 Tax=Puccinia graminis f. sp. tritici TaxID=56615 RepID=A0A5B0SGP8_PUCGR|nr:hypothetical protein PGT21_023843 [Puccinia graminis f. sp. tritici]KAA1137012.1 hypothetical protein PGTUg99_003639 [Puccinia graminis f. sp. tritici]
MESSGGGLKFNYKPNDARLVGEDVKEIHEKRVMIYSDGTILSVKEECKSGIVPSFEVIVGHTVNNDCNSLRAKYLLDNNHIRIPEGTKLKDGDRVNFYGSLEGIDSDLGIMVVQVYEGMYENTNEN